MRKLVYGAGLVLLLVLAFLAGHWYTSGNPAEVASPGRQILYYVDPMNPAHTSDKPGLAPCGMKMEPVYADEGSPGKTPAGTAATMSPGTIRITPEKQQVIGVRTGVAEKAAVNHTIRTVGRIAADEKRVYRLVAGVDGWIRETYNNDTGTLVKKNERLAAFYSPQLRAAQISYLSLFGSPDDRFRAGGRQALAPSQQASISLQTYIDALESLGMSEQQIKEIGETMQIADRIYIVAPATGFILSRNVSPGQRFDKGAEWYRIADLSKVWVLADLFRNEAQFVKPGTQVKVTLPRQKKEYHAMVSKVLPQFDAASRTLKVRLEMDNPGYEFKPDMFVDVEFPVRLPSALTVPSDAVLDSGTRKTVFVDRGNGFFEPRRVETGLRLGDRVEITGGLMPGEQIVISGNFLIDSDSKMKMAAAGMYAKKDGQVVKDPVCGMEVDPKTSKGAGLFLEYGGMTYYFCMTQCKQQFVENPGRYVETRAGGSGSKGAKRETPAPQMMPEQEHSMQGHSMEPPGKPPLGKPMDMPEPDRAPHQGMAPHD
jgi:membrane fusion protein, copper/silver efflux system